METARQLGTELIALLRRAGLWWGLAISVAMAVVSIAIAVVVVLSWPPQRFSERSLPPPPGPARPLVVRALVALGKNLTGVLLVVFGLIMAVPGVPGQGLLTMIIGITILDIPGKRRLEGRLVRGPRVLGMLNRLRVRFGKQPLILD